MPIPSNHLQRTTEQKARLLAKQAMGAYEGKRGGARGLRAAAALIMERFPSDPDARIQASCLRIAANKNTYSDDD